MTEILFVTWDGGGNVPPTRGLADELRARGHRVRVRGHADQADSFEGFDFAPFRSARPFRAVEGVAPVPLLRVLADRAMGADVLAELEERPADLVVVDCLLFGVMDALAGAGHPYVALEHTFDVFLRRAAHGPLGLILRARGFPALRLIESATTVLVTALPELDDVRDGRTHVGPVVRGVTTAPSEPTVLVSLSTVGYRALEATWQRMLDAVEGLPAKVIATVGPATDLERLRIPDGVDVHRWLPHGEVLPRTSLVVSHGGHSTAMAALAHDVPLLVLPLDPSGDQRLVGRRVAEAGAGRVVGRRSGPSRLRPAIEDLLADGPHREAAAGLGARIRELDGRTRGADVLESLVSYQL